MLTQYEKFKSILREMFQMDQADLDFGIYRIMNAKRDEIGKFLDKDLLPQVSAEFVRYRGTEIEEKKKELITLETTLRDSGVSPDEAPKVKALREEIAAYGDDEALSNDVFSHLSAFFRRYYDNGDFLSLRRYKKDIYAIPYEGEEVKLHWANADQYYIKTSEYLRDYAFRLTNGKRVHFKLIDATEEKDNIKQEAGKERKFKLHEEEPVRIDGNDAYIQFVYLAEKEKQDNLNKKTIEILSAEVGKKLQDFSEVFAPAPTAKNPKRSILEKHLYSYTARFNFDFFIHKDLGGFLRRELDFYIKNEVLFVDDLDAQDDKKLKSAIAKVKVLKHIAQKIITFLAQLEDFQKKLWLKKKFVVNCGWCVTLDRVPEALYPEIVKNAAQTEEWVKIFAIDEIKADLSKPGYSDPLTVDFLKANPYLILDTKHFSEKFKEKLLASFENLDESCDGLIINSENFQALNMLLAKYREQVNGIYIDPPYNTNSSEIIYKNNYKHASWLSLLQDRLAASKEFMSKKGIICVTIDDMEMQRLWMLLGQEFGFENHLGTAAIRINPGGRKTDRKIALQHEYAILFAREYGTEVAKIPIPPEEKTHNYKQAEDGTWFEERNLRKEGQDSLARDGSERYYPIYCDPKTGRLSTRERLPIEILPIDTAGKKRIWRKDRDDIDGLYEKGDLVFKNVKTGPQIYFKFRGGLEGETPKSLWLDNDFSASEYGTPALEDRVGSGKFDFPKSTNAVAFSIRVLSDSKNMMVLDYFAGSGTTGHAVIDLNREDNGKRKYILVEMGQYFDTVLKPRIQKVIYSKDWKDGKPVSREGISHMFKYMLLEGYDDTLDNLEVARTQEQQKTLGKMTTHAREDYQLSYMLDIETRGSDSLLNINRFNDPFHYTLKIRKDNELKEQAIDLVETFNYLIGLYVAQTETIRGFKVVRGKLRTGEKTLVIWRNTSEKSNDELNEFFKKQKYNTLDFEFDLIFVNGDNNLENIKIAEDKWKVRLIEEEFKKHMFEQAGV